MKITPGKRRTIKAENALFIVLVLALATLLAWLSTRYEWQADWTANNRNSVSQASAAVLAAMEGPVEIRAFIGEANLQLRSQVQHLIDIYRREKGDISLTLINPQQEPQLVREMNLSEGDLLIDYDGRQERLSGVSEQGLTNALQRLSRGGERWIVMLGGHDERSPQGTAEYDYRLFSRQMEARGLKTRQVNLAQENALPDNTALLVLADPRKPLLPGEIQILQDYLDGGGNFLWLAEPGPLGGLEPLAEQLGIEWLGGMIVDPNVQLLGISDPRFALVADYPPHAITRDFDTITLFPLARAIETLSGEEWEAESILETLPRSWLERGELSGDEVSFDKGEDIAGPLVLGLALNRKLGAAEIMENRDEGADEEMPAEVEEGERQQRVVLIGDADFLADSYVGNGGNLDLGLSLLNWLVHDDALIRIPARTAVDTRLELSNTLQATIGFGFLLLVPLALLGAGIGVWMKRRKG